MSLYGACFGVGRNSGKLGVVPSFVPCDNFSIPFFFVPVGVFFCLLWEIVLIFWAFCGRMWDEMGNIVYFCFSFLV